MIDIHIDAPELLIIAGVILAIYTIKWVSRRRS